MALTEKNYPSTLLSVRLRHPAFPQPQNTSRKVWRYLSFPKFVSLLSSKSLYFSRIDNLNDLFEGTVPAQTIRALDESIKAQGHSQGYALISGAYIDSRRSTYVSCWHMSDYESEAMWRLYGGADGGIAVQTTYQALLNSIEPHGDVHIGAVSYIDYEKEMFPGGNQFYQVMHKRKSFWHEQEIRMVQVCPPDAINNLTPESLSLPWNPEEHVSAIYVTPYAENYYFDAVSAVVKALCPALEEKLLWSRMRGCGLT